MTKPLDPEIKALRALHRALAGLPPAVQSRVLHYWMHRVIEQALAKATLEAVQP